MSTCSTCQQSTISGASFCHHCGTSLGDSDCLNCGYHNPSGWSRCENCGLAPGMTTEEVEEITKNFVIDFREIPNIQPQIEKYFYGFLAAKTRSEFGSHQVAKYLDLFQNSDYPNEVKEMAEGLSEKVYTIHCKQIPSIQREIDNLLTFTFSSYVNEFFVSYGSLDDSNPSQAPESDNPEETGQPIKQHFNKEKTRDFFNGDNPSNKIYTDLNRLPARMLDEVKKNFLFNAPEENVLLIFDDTVFGSGSTGFALTEKAVYWKSHFKDAQRVYFSEVHSLEMDNDTLLINDIVFEIETDMNRKVYDWLRQEVFTGMEG